jgi:hypothetical protein
VLFGKGYYDGPVTAGSDLLPRPVWERYVHNFLNIRKGLLGLLPEHEEMLRLMEERAVIGESASRQPSTSATPLRGLALGPPVPVMIPADHTSLSGVG